MEKYPVILFLLRYVAGSVLLYLNIRKKKGETLLEVFKYTFLALSIIMFLNYLLSLRPASKHESLFYDVNFIDFVIITLFVNLVHKTKKVPKPE
jgi:hypothetical protein